VIDRAKDGASDRIYSNWDKANHEGKPVLRTATDDPAPDTDERLFVAPTSMRDVEPSVHVWHRFKNLDERA